MNESTNSLLGRLDQLQDGDEQAMNTFWQRYFDRLVRLADGYMKKKGVAGRTFDGDDVAASALESFFSAVQKDRFDKLRDEEGLLRLLKKMVTNKVTDRVRKQKAEKRGGGKVRGDSAFGDPDSSSPGGLDGCDGEEPTADWIAVMDEVVESMFEKLGKDDLKTVARMRFAGYSNAEIAKELGCSLATAERRLKMIKACWSRESP